VSQCFAMRLFRVLLLTVTLAAWAQAGAQPPTTAQQQAMRAAAAAAREALVAGPASVPLRDEATLALPEHFGFIPRQQAVALMSAMGNRTGDGFLGLIVPRGEHRAWFVAVVYQPSGYIKDEDAKHWNADKLLESLKEGTEASNAERVRAGIPAIVVTRWIEPPAYEPDSHQLVWSAEARRKDGSDGDPTVNYNTYLLGREGYVSLNLITGASTVDTDKEAARQLLSAVSFIPGKRYADFNSSTDKVAAYGLAALVAGVAAKKLGLLALLAATIVKFAKVIVVAAAGLFAAIARWLKGRAGRQA
jgi:uncharacterized membrane-anchored protein